MVNYNINEINVPAIYWDSDYLYHYTSIQTAVDKIINTGSLKLGSFCNTSDPFEYNPIQIGVGFGVTTPEEDNYKRKIGYSLAKRLTNELENYRFISFCTSDNQPDNYDKLGFLKQRMWSQYAEKHSGACLVFSKDQIQKILKRKMLDFYSQNIQYLEFDNGFWTYPAIDVPDGMNQDENDLFLSHLERYRNEYFFTKHLDYQDEMEFRIIVSYPESSSYIFKFEDSLRAIIISDKADKKYIDESLLFVSKINIPLLSLGWNYRTPMIFQYIIN